MIIYFEKESNEIFDFDVKKLIISVVQASAEHEMCPFDIELCVTLTDNNTIHKINKEYRNIDKPTDVLSFPMVEYECAADFSNLNDYYADYFNPENNHLILGDIIISVEKARSQAEEYGHSLIREIAFLTAHSMLHLFGYDHMEDEERIEMENRQREILDKLNITR